MLASWILLHHVFSTFLFSRPDRDQYVTLNKQNMEPGRNTEYQFRIPREGNYVPLDESIPYDYLSIMHYGKNFMARGYKQVYILDWAGKRLIVIWDYLSLYKKSYSSIRPLIP